MKFLTQKTDVLSRASQCAVVFALDDTLLPSAALLDEQLNGLLCDLLTRGDLKSKPGQLRWIPVASSSPLKCERALLVHLGKSSGKKNRRVSAEQVVTALAASANALTRSPVKEASFFLDELFVEQQGLTIEKDDAAVGPEWFAEQLAKTLVYSSYRYTETHSDPDPKPALSKVIYATASTATTRQLNAGLKRGGALGNGINLARELGNLPPNICTPIYLAELAKSMATGNGRLSSRSLTEKQMDKLGMNAFVSVAKGSYQDARLVIMEYKGTAAASSKPHVLVGKGITFDTGGISLKPGPSMDEMKFDMCGAASVFGTMRALIDMDAKVHVIGVVAAAENMPDGKASKPGDVVKSLSGQTIEILNTDAEGRLVLCDTLTYVERFKPRSVVDIATLTGACVVALGNHASGLYSNHQPMAEKLLNAGRQANDRAWQMPLWDDYQKQLDSNFADMANIGGPAAGSVTAACFLSRFAKKYHWAHLDIAGTAWHSGAKKGATGRPVGLLVNYLLNA